jgi:hypothetical protein
MAACADADSAASDNHDVCTKESTSEYDFDGDQECDSDAGFTMGPSKPYAESAKTPDELSLGKRLARADTVAVSEDTVDLLTEERGADGVSCVGASDDCEQCFRDGGAA